MTEPVRSTEVPVRCHCTIRYSTVAIPDRCHKDTPGPDAPFCNECEDRHPELAETEAIVGTVPVETRR